MNALRKAVDRARGLFLLGRGMLRLAASGNTARNVQGGFDIADAALSLGWDKLSLERLRSDPNTAALMRRRFGAGQRYSAERLARAPVGSLGRILHDNLAAGYDPDFYRRPPVRTDWEWASHRGRQIHDVLHIVTGYPLTSTGEIGVFAFLAGNGTDYGCLLISATAAAGHLLARPHRLALDISVFSRAFLCGQRVRSVLGIEFEDLLEKSIFEVRERIGIPRYGLGVVDCPRRLGGYSFRELDHIPIPKVPRNALTLAEARV